LVEIFTLAARNLRKKIYIEVPLLIILGYLHAERNVSTENNHSQNNVIKPICSYLDAKGPRLLSMKSASLK
jgi:hypothetical protein